MAPDRSSLRRLRSRIPTSPLPWHWHTHINRGVLAGIVVLAVAGALAAVLSQRGSSDEASSPKGEAAALGKRSLEQKVDSLLVSGFDDPAGAEARLRSAELGGIVVGAEDWAAGGRGLVSRLRRAGASGAGRVPPLLVARQEGGAYRSYPDLPPAVRQLDVGAQADPAIAQSWALEAGAALGKAGFDLNLAPLADVATLDSPVADRAFSDDPALVAAMVSAAARGCRQSGLACAFSHFPGLGAASDDTATGPATVSLDRAALAARDLEPFRAAFAAGAPATVLSLAFYAAYDPVTPAALSPAIATGLLRDELKFKGVAITDDLGSGAITAGVGAPEAAVQAIAAGSDLVVIDDPAQAKQAREALLEAARSGALPPERLDQAAARVLKLKRELGMLGGGPNG
jgi:beta-N-acetylhexosaminidase